MPYLSEWDLHHLLAPVSLTALFAPLVTTTPGHMQGHSSWKFVCCPLLVLHKPLKDSEASSHIDSRSKEVGERMGNDCLQHCHCKHIGGHQRTCPFMKCTQLHKEDNEPRLLDTSIITIS